MLAVMDSYTSRRSEVEAYFDRVAADRWAALTSDAPVGRIRASVRAGRDAMRALLLSWLPENLAGRRILDAGCGTGAFAVEAAQRGAEVLAVDLSPTLIALARERVPAGLAGRLRFEAGDMLAVGEARFDHVVAMDSFIHYSAADMVNLVAQLARRAERSLLFTFAPRTPLLAVMHAAGKLFPRGNRSPAIQPVAEGHLLRAIAATPALATWAPARSHRVAHGFYTSQALELVRR